jgi:hypothetical protein
MTIGKSIATSLNLLNLSSTRFQRISSALPHRRVISSLRLGASRGYVCLTHASLQSLLQLQVQPFVGRHEEVDQLPVLRLVPVADAVRRHPRLRFP